MTDTLTPPLCLPPELLVPTFELATYNHVRNLDGMVDMAPFESVYSDEAASKCASALRTKHYGP